MARAHILGAAGGLGHRAIWKWPGLKEHLCNWVGGKLDNGLVQALRTNSVPHSGVGWGWGGTSRPGLTTRTFYSLSPLTPGRSTLSGTEEQRRGV